MATESTQKGTQTVVLRAYRSEAEAELAAGYLRANGIHALATRDTIEAAPFFRTPQAARVRVLAAEADAAQALLDELDAPPFTDPTAAVQLPPLRPRVGRHTLGFTLLIGGGFLLLFGVLPLLVPPTGSLPDWASAAALGLLAWAIAMIGWRFWSSETERPLPTDTDDTR